MNEERPVGREVEWQPREPPGDAPLSGDHVLLRAIHPSADVQSLFAVSHPPARDPAIWTYLPYGPFETAQDMGELLRWAQSSTDPQFFAIVGLPDRRPLGMCAYLRITPEFGVIEIGHIWFGTTLQRTTAATEAIYLLSRHVFDDLGYRRLEWKCDSLNAASRRAAERFGFTFEGIFRNHQVVKGRNRDTAWYAILVEDWPAIRTGFESWLAEANFEGETQRRTLTELIALARQP